VFGRSKNGGKPGAFKSRFEITLGIFTIRFNQVGAARTSSVLFTKYDAAPSLRDSSADFQGWVSSTSPRSGNKRVSYDRRHRGSLSIRPQFFSATPFPAKKRNSAT